MLKTCAFSLALLVGFVSASFGQTLNADKENSKIGFTGKKPDGKHVGGFKDMKAEAKVDLETPSKSSLMIEIKTDSLWSDDEKLTGHLKNPDFFDVKKYPTIKFESTKVEMNEGSGKIIGKMTMLDKTVEVEVPVKADVSDKAVKIVADFKIDRTKWGMAYGKGKIDDNVEIKAELLFPRK
jgi:polyisoprenoid-binding protein YceI